MWIHIDLPIFSSPIEAYGSFSGDIEVETMPSEGFAFPWPSGWLAKFADVFAAQSTQVWGVSKWEHGESARHVTMYGLVLNDRGHAEELVNHLEAVSQLDFSLHDVSEVGDA